MRQIFLCCLSKPVDLLHRGGRAVRHLISGKEPGQSLMYAMCFVMLQLFTDLHGQAGYRYQYQG